MTCSSGDFIAVCGWSSYLCYSLTSSSASVQPRAVWFVMLMLIWIWTEAMLKSHHSQTTKYHNSSDPRSLLCCSYMNITTMVSADRPAALSHHCRSQNPQTCQSVMVKPPGAKSRGSSLTQTLLLAFAVSVPLSASPSSFVFIFLYFLQVSV